MPKGLVFDLDGVLTNPAVYHLTAWDNLARELGIDLTGGQLDSLGGISRMDSLNLILKYDGREDKYSEAGKEKFVEEKNIKFVGQVEKTMPAGIPSDILKLLSDVKKQNLKMITASASKNTPEILTRLGIMDELDGIVDPVILHQGKPDPETYEKVQKLLGLSTNKIISSGDVRASVQLIESAGQFAVGTGDKEVLKEVDYIVPTTKELKLSEIKPISNKK